MKYFKIIFFSILILIVLGVAGASFYYYKTLNKPNSNITENVLVEIKSGESISDISTGLTSAGVLTSTKVFDLTTKFFKISVKPGFYEIAPNMSMAEVINLLESGKTKIVKITFPEGWRAEQVAKRLNDNKILKYEDFMAVAAENEGKLFPDTYFFNPRMSASDVVNMMTTDYKERISGLGVTNDDLIIASIVEREAANDADRALIAGIYKNRINIGMKLQSDPTVEYGRDLNNLAKLSAEEQKDYYFWKSAKTVEFTSVVSDYNTYQVKGLPKGPICNAGIASINATLSPTKSDYYYFLYGKDGKIHPAKTSAEHQQNIMKYM
jgi:UPF0755 protein